MARLAILLLSSFVFLSGFAQEEFVNGTDNDVTSISYSPDGEYIVAGCWDGNVYIYSNDSVPELLVSFSDNVSPVTSVSFTRDSRKLLVAGQDGSIRQYAFMHKDSMDNLFALDTTYQFSKRPINKASYGPGMRMLFAADDNNRLIAYDTKKKVHRDVKTAGPVRTYAISVDRMNYYLTTSGNPAIIQYNIQGNEIRRFEGHTNDVNALAVTLDRKYLISASADKTVRIWNLQTGDLEHTFTDHTWEIKGLMVDPYSKYIVSCGIDGLVNVYSIEEKKLLHSYTSKNGMCMDVSISPDLKNLAVALQVNNPSNGHGYNLLASGVERPKTQQEIRAEEIEKAKAEKQRIMEEKIKARQDAKAAAAVDKTDKSDKTEKPKKVIQKTDQVEISIED